MGYIALGLFLIGLALLIVEMFVPGFGIPGIMGIVAVIAAGIVTAKTFTYGLYILLGGIVVLTVVISIVLRWMMKHQMHTKLILHDSIGREQQEFEDLNYFLGKEGTTVTSLRPYGTVDFHGVRVESVSYGPYIAEGQKVQVIEVNKQKIIVKEIASNYN